MAGGETPNLHKNPEQRNYKDELQKMSPKEQVKIARIRAVLIKNARNEKNDPENVSPINNILENFDDEICSQDIVKLLLGINSGSIDSNSIEVGDKNHKIIHYALIEHPELVATKELLKIINTQR